ncbi:MAG: tyrosine-protein phosphatase, partial [Candidatus Thorarchaeota archaeon]
NEWKKQYLAQFELLTKKLIKKYEIELPQLQTVVKLLHAILNRDFIWNIRDANLIASQFMRSGLLYRSSSLSRYLKDEYLKKTLIGLKVKSLLDLRAPNEKKEQDHYISFLKNLGIEYNEIPISQKELGYEYKLKLSTPGSLDSFSEVFPRYYQEEIRNILLDVITMEKPLLIHCHAGRDRTGLVIALIQSILGFSKQEVIQDYLNTGLGTNKDGITIFFKVLEEFGGITEYIKHIGLSSDYIIRLKETFN